MRSTIQTEPESVNPPECTRTVGPARKDVLESIIAAHPPSHRPENYNKDKKSTKHLLLLITIRWINAGNPNPQHQALVTFNSEAVAKRRNNLQWTMKRSKKN